MKLDGKVVLVTGSSQGIDQSIAIRLAQVNNQVFELNGLELK